PLFPYTTLFRSFRTDVAPHDARPVHAGDDLVVDGAQGVGPFPGGRLTGAAVGEQHDLLTQPRLVVAAIHDDLVHAHAADDRTSPATEPHLHSARQGA